MSSHLILLYNVKISGQLNPIKFLGPTAASDGRTEIELTFREPIYYHQNSVSWWPERRWFPQH